MSRFFLLITFLAVQTACSRIDESQDQLEKKYFDLRFFIEDQIKILSILQPELEKKIQIDGHTEEVRTHPDSSQWAGELELFRQTDLNKPVLRDLYSIEDTVLGNDLQVIILSEQEW